MTDEELGIVLKYRQANWPHAPLTADSLEVFQLECSGLDFDATIATLRESFADSQFGPTPMQLRNAVMRRGREDVSWEALLDELLRAVASVGYSHPEPEWSHPALAAFVRQSGGWLTVCQSTPAAGSQGFTTWRAQSRDHLRGLLESEDRSFVRDALGAGEQLRALDSRIEQIGSE